MRRSLLGTRIITGSLWCSSRYSSTSSESKLPNKDGNPTSDSTTTKTENSSKTTSASLKEGELKEEYSIPTAEIIRAVRQRDFNAFQTHAADIVQHKWKEEHSIPAACILFFLLTWYWSASARRRVVRSCKATEAKVKEEAEQTLELVNTLVRKWRQDVQRADQQLQLILDKNGELTKDIDRMTAALRQCYVSSPGSKGIQAKEIAHE